MESRNGHKREGSKYKNIRNVTHPKALPRADDVLGGGDDGVCPGLPAVRLHEDAAREDEVEKEMDNNIKRGKL